MGEREGGIGGGRRGEGIREMEGEGIGEMEGNGSDKGRPDWVRKSGYLEPIIINHFSLVARSPALTSAQSTASQCPSPASRSTQDG